eukprot:CAMPEP_0204584948 /NCGR_PEP_ID=MMETSP0661-20131031/46633_1 /ASSEMBLY_ACC=CAM_ASM_000606 /TAXON_ID=109239 /ORGANISM="Alexandrium margalefi, Strain AMGDE01CS-322" /LENGTH=381 /DNA_ID=CAMNT_0051594453 /DNA_START=64 /DNA_END=1209 /DNA_ORIENTATION=+
MDRNRSRSPHGVSSCQETVRLVMMREQARSQKDWSLADTIRDKLVASGVTLFDKTHSWKSSDGQTGRIPTFSEIEAGHTPESFMAQQEARAAQVPAGDGSEAHIKHLVQMREQARAQKDWGQSDSLRDELKAQGVDIFDKEKMWRSSTGASGVILGYRAIGGPTDLEISTLVVQRERARQSSDFATSDMIRDELMAVGVQIQDREKTWRSNDGRQGTVPSWTEIIAGGSAVPSGVRSVASPGMAQGKAGGLQDQVVQAALAAAQNPNSAMRTLQMLQQAARGRAVVPRAATATSGSVNAECQAALDFISQCQTAGRPAQDAEIEWLVSLREKFRQMKDFPSSDALRNAMRNTLGIHFEEKEKMWKSNDGRMGAIPMWGSIA